MSAEVKRRYHLTGGLAAEEVFVNGIRDGVSRAWHPNGVLASETPYRDGVIDGVGRQWNDKGELLGSFIVRNGTGVVRTWGAHGGIIDETTIVGGKETGRQRVWDPHGDLAHERYCIDGKTVSRRAYAEACKKDPALPVYEEVTIGRAGRTPDQPEAISWLEGRPAGRRTLGEWPTTEAAVAFVKELYTLGAKEVSVVDIQTYDKGEENTGTVLISLPKSKRARAKLFAWHAQWVQQQGFEPEDDEGQDFLLVRLD